MPYRAKGPEVQEEISEGQWKTIKTYSGSQANKKAQRMATAKNLAHARKKGYDVPPEKK